MLKIASATLPAFSLNRNAKLIDSRIERHGHVPNYNTNFSPVSGVKPKRIKWFIEAENRTKDDPVILYLHGGSYALGMFPTMSNMLFHIWKKVHNDRLSILWLDYTLSGKAPFPKQLQELIAVMNELQKTCHNIILMGDSAGGHLILIMLRHMYTAPFATVPQRVGRGVDGRANITTIVLLSAWVQMGYDKDEMPWSEAFVPDKTLLKSKAMNPYIDDETNWRSILPDELWVAYGGDEPTRKEIEQFNRLAQIHERDIFLEEDGGHDSLAIYSTRSGIMKPIIAWFRGLFARQRAQNRGSVRSEMTMMTKLGGGQQRTTSGSGSGSDSSSSTNGITSSGSDRSSVSSVSSSSSSSSPLYKNGERLTFGSGGKGSVGGQITTAVQDLSQFASAAAAYTPSSSSSSSTPTTTPTTTTTSAYAPATKPPGTAVADEDDDDGFDDEEAYKTETTNLMLASLRDMSASQMAENEQPAPGDHDGRAVRPALAGSSHNPADTPYEIQRKLPPPISDRTTPNTATAHNHRSDAIFAAVGALGYNNSIGEVKGSVTKKTDDPLSGNRDPHALDRLKSMAHVVAAREHLKKLLQETDDSAADSDGSSFSTTPTMSPTVVGHLRSAFDEPRGSSLSEGRASVSEEGLRSGSRSSTSSNNSQSDSKPNSWKRIAGAVTPS